MDNFFGLFLNKVKDENIFPQIVANGVIDL